MSRFLVLEKNDDSVKVLDSTDALVETISVKDYKYCLDNNIDIGDFSNKNNPFGIMVNGNAYSLYLMDKQVYSGHFPKENNRNNLFDFNITILSVNYFKGDILVFVSCSCFCKYDIEMPMSMLHVIKFYVNKKVCSGNLCLYTGSPVYFVSKRVAKNECYGKYSEDYPSDCCVDYDDMKLHVSEKYIKIFGTEFSCVYYMDICKCVKFLNV